MADEERFVVNQQDIQEIVKRMNVATKAVIRAKVYVEGRPDAWLYTLLRIPDFLDAPPSVRRDVFHMLKTWYSGERENLKRIRTQMRGAWWCLTEVYEILGRVLWGEDAVKAGEYPDWWRDLLLGDSDHS